jgi:hypothetical protein
MDNFIDDGFNNNLRPPTTDSQTENPNVNYNAPCNYNNNNYLMINGDTSSAYTNIPGNVTTPSQSYPTNNTPGNITMPSQSFPTTSSYTNTLGNITTPSQYFPTTSSNSSHPLPQYTQQNPSLFNTSQINHSEIFTFDIPGIKIIVISIFPPMINSSQTYHSEIFTIDIPGSKVVIIALSFQ